MGSGGLRVFEFTCFLIELSDLLVCVVNDFWGTFSNVIGKSVLELNSELLNDDAEASESALDVLGLLVLQGLASWRGC